MPEKLWIEQPSAFKFPPILFSAQMIDLGQAPLLGLRIMNDSRRFLLCPADLPKIDAKAR